MSTVPFEDQFAERETAGIGSRIAAVKLAMRGSFIEEISPIFRIWSIGAISRTGSCAIIAFRQRSYHHGFVLGEKSDNRFGTLWSFDEELVAIRSYSKTGVVSAAKKPHSVHISSSSAANSASSRPLGIGVIGGIGSRGSDPRSYDPYGPYAVRH